jgi:hypothetical protein
MPKDTRKAAAVGSDEEKDYSDEDPDLDGFYDSDSSHGSGTGYSKEQIKQFHIVLTKKIIAASTPGVGKTRAFNEWKANKYVGFGAEVEPENCICGHALHKGAYEIINVKDPSKILYPIGSTCVTYMGGRIAEEAKKLSRVWCICGSGLADQASYNKHLTSKKHLMFLWPSCDGCHKKYKEEDLQTFDNKRHCSSCRGCFRCRNIIEKYKKCAHCNKHQTSTYCLPDSSYSAVPYIKCQRCPKKFKPKFSFCKLCYECYFASKKT